MINTYIIYTSIYKNKNTKSVNYNKHNKNELIKWKESNPKKRARVIFVTKEEEKNTNSKDKYHSIFLFCCRVCISVFQQLLFYFLFSCSPLVFPFILIYFFQQIKTSNKKKR